MKIHMNQKSESEENNGTSRFRSPRRTKDSCPDKRHRDGNQERPDSFRFGSVTFMRILGQQLCAFQSRNRANAQARPRITAPRTRAASSQTAAAAGRRGSASAAGPASQASARPPTLGVTSKCVRDAYFVANWARAATVILMATPLLEILVQM